jgi:hypothetical protein
VDTHDAIFRYNEHDLFFTSMMSFMGMGMSPLESAMIGNNADTATGEVQSTDNAYINPTDGTSGSDDSDAGSSFDGFDRGFDGF